MEGNYSMDSLMAFLKTVFGYLEDIVNLVMAAFGAVVKEDE